MKSIHRYLEEIKVCIERLSRDDIKKIVDILFEAYKNGKHIFIMGNGGSAATAAHFACDLNKFTISGDKKRFKATSLTDNISLMSAWANDTDYEHIFSEQLLHFIDEKDVVIGISASGNSN